MDTNLFINTDISLGNVINENVTKNTPDRAKLIQKIQKITKYRERQDIKKWRRALQRAENPRMPDREQLMKTYDDVMIDCHINGIIESYIKIVESTKFSILDGNGESSDDLKKIFLKKWFAKYVKYIIESLFYGYSLIQFCDITNNTFNDVKLVDRAYVIPEWEVIKTSSSPITSPSQGISWNLPPYNKWTIMVDTGTLGLLNIASPHAIAKKNLFNSAWEYADIFGMPIRMGHTNMDDPQRRENMENMLENMGSFAWGSFDLDDKLELVEGNKTDVFKVFLEPINTSNREISKAFAGQTMMFEDGSSYSQSQVHEDLFEIFLKSMLTKVGYNVNEMLIPFMALHGMISTEATFKWQVEERLKTMEKKQIIADLSPYYTFTPEFVSDYLNIEVEGIKGEETNNSGTQSVLKEVTNLYKDAL